jgi:hypothetical protein
MAHPQAAAASLTGATGVTAAAGTALATGSRGPRRWAGSRQAHHSGELHPSYLADGNCVVSVECLGWALPPLTFHREDRMPLTDSTLVRLTRRLPRLGAFGLLPVLLCIIIASSHAGEAPILPPGTGEVDALRRTPVVRVIEQARAAVVNIQSERNAVPGTGAGLGAGAGEGRVNGMGTGVVIDPRGLIVTNNHVVEGCDGPAGAPGRWHTTAGPRHRPRPRDGPGHHQGGPAPPPAHAPPGHGQRPDRRRAGHRDWQRLRLRAYRLGGHHLGQGAGRDAQQGDGLPLADPDRRGQSTPATRAGRCSTSTAS